MAKEDVIKLFRAAQAEPSIRERLNSAPNPEAFVKMAQEFGYNFTVEEWQEVTRFSVEELKGDLSEIPGI
jgi:predicted ribosomally synthesized peptide with nif11-like leader